MRVKVSQVYSQVPRKKGQELNRGCLIKLLGGGGRRERRGGRERNKRIGDRERGGKRGGYSLYILSICIFIFYLEIMLCPLHKLFNASELFR